MMADQFDVRLMELGFLNTDKYSQVVIIVGIIIKIEIFDEVILDA